MGALIVGSTVDLRVLGPVELRLGDGPVELGPRKQRAVLAMLNLRAGRTVPTDALIEGLWGEDPPASATKVLPALRLSPAAAAGRQRRGRSSPTAMATSSSLGEDEVDAARCRAARQARPPARRAGALAR